MLLIFILSLFITQGLFLQGIAASYVFNICEQLKLPPPVSFVAVELYDKSVHSLTQRSPLIYGVII